MTAKLIQVDPEQAWELTENVFTVGRRVTSDIRLDCQSVSRDHARIEYKTAGWHVLDLGSANGTLINGTPAAASVKLKHGDVLKFGRRFLRFEQEGNAEGEESVEESAVTVISNPELRPVTMLVADLEGFTAMSAGMASNELAAAVRTWCDGCVHILEKHGGCLDKFIGDCVFAWWQGNESEVKESALAAAQEILSIPSPAGAPPFRCGAALHSGQVALCRMPDNSHTLLGTQVNTTFRMESLTRPLKRSLLVSDTFAENFTPKQGQLVSCGQHEVKGLPEKVTVFAFEP